MKIKSVATLVLKITALVVVMFVLFTLGSSYFTADSSIVQNMTPDEASAAGMMLLVVSLIDTLILTYFITRSRLHGWRLMLTTSLVFYGVKTFLSIIEAWWFMDTVSEIEVSGLFLMTVPMAVLFPVAAVWILGKAKPPEEPDQEENARLVMPRGQFIAKFAVLAVVVYPLLFFAFGYFVAFANPDLVAYYHTSRGETFWVQLQNVWRNDPLVFLLEFARGAIWVGLALPVIRYTKGRVWQAGLLLVLLFSIVQNDVHLIPGAMPPSVRMSHFVETASSNAIFAVIITWLMHRAHTSVGDLFSLGDPER